MPNLSIRSLSIGETSSLICRPVGRLTIVSDALARVAPFSRLQTPALVEEPPNPQTTYTAPLTTPTLLKRETVPATSLPPLHTRYTARTFFTLYHLLGSCFCRLRSFRTTHLPPHYARLIREAHHCLQILEHLAFSCVPECRVLSALQHIFYAQKPRQHPIAGSCLPVSLTGYQQPADTTGIIAGLSSSCRMPTRQQNE